MHVVDVMVKCDSFSSHMKACTSVEGVMRPCICLFHLFEVNSTKNVVNEIHCPMKFHAMEVTSDGYSTRTFLVVPISIEFRVKISLIGVIVINQMLTMY